MIRFAIPALILIAFGVWLALHQPIPTVYSLQARVDALEARIAKLEACE